MAVVLALEGLAYAIAPATMRRALLALAATPDQGLRMGGLAAAVIGVGLAWLLQGG
ncbi:hypothetical protein FHS88_001145 [Roseomonas alkaliterrae]|uniref:DUF2065 domain-containing protein n=1 Tax=Neoroseomonas alkaliterrae TaxID=1452450 RepID=A0A840XQQ9_9PROT|nr:hypothetical protein [Neoroseomonas alkaliterrae]